MVQSTTLPSSIHSNDAPVSRPSVKLKRFESVVARLLPIVQPIITELPPAGRPDMPLLSLYHGVYEVVARVHGTGPGQIADEKRAIRKEQQVQSIIQCIFAMLPPNNNAFTNDDHRQPPPTGKEEPYTIVDFGGGSGHLSIPLALLLPMCRVITIDLKAKSLELLHQKAEQYIIDTTTPLATTVVGHVQLGHPSKHNDLSTKQLRQCPTIPNLYTFHGPLESFTLKNFDMGVALHLCGEATDVALRMCCGLVQVSALVFAPCCVGKLSSRAGNPYRFQATGSNTPSVSYPQSKVFCQIIPNNNDNDDKDLDWNCLAQAADYDNVLELRTSRNVVRRTAKVLLEADRCLYLEEQFGYRTAFTRMEPWEASPKHDIILAWRASIVEPLLGPVNTEAAVDLQRAVECLLPPLLNSGTVNATSMPWSMPHAVDWTSDEEYEIRQQLQSFVDSDDGRLIFPTGVGPRRRKLVHHLAEQMNLAHWSHGAKYSLKTVVVAKRDDASNQPAARKRTMRQDDNRRLAPQRFFEA